MGFVKAVSKVFKKISDGSNKLFKKGAIGDTKLFGKSSIGSHLLGNVSKGLMTGANVARQVGNEIGNFANNSVVNGILGASGSTGQAILAGAHGLSAGLGGVNATMRLGSELTKEKNYSGGAGNVASNILEKAKAVHDAGNGIQFV